MSLRIHIDQNLERKFREAAMRRFGYGKGALSKAAEEAILKWISTVESESLSFEGDPVEAIDGLLSDIDIDSVELQHETTKIWALKVLKNVSN
jgi:uncharacterized protein YggL (DUF469 family)